jgi:hypothetical protein
MVARLSVIFGDGTKNFLDGDLLTAVLRSNREVDVFVLRLARQNFSTSDHPPGEIYLRGEGTRMQKSRSAAGLEEPSLGQLYL